ncbi:MAG: leucyl aminopeptidase [Hyphomicrobiales bacterium]|nr:leucyl aminopeptidase [Hyphomicrobiales bacterium]
MKDNLKIEIASLKNGAAGDAADATLVAFCGPELSFGPITAKALQPGAAAMAIAAKVAHFTGKAGQVLDMLAPTGLGCARLIVFGQGDKDGKEAPAPTRHLHLGGKIRARLSGGESRILCEAPGAPAWAAEAICDMVTGLQLRDYKFNRYKSKKADDTENNHQNDVTFLVADAAAVKKALARQAGLTEGVALARDLVNEPPNVLFPEEFAKRAKELTALGVEVEVLGEKDMAKLGMGALLAVGQGSKRDSQMVIMRWRGVKSGKDKDAAKPIAFIGKGVVFDTGGISIKPAAGMEDMKGDMGGAACVVGLMHALASRKAKVDVIGAIGIVENMPDGNAYRPGDIVKSMSGQTIEVINTDAEGRLVLADVLWYVQDRFKPAFMINLATLTGAIIVALGQDHAGLFSNNDALSAQLASAGQATGESVWRMPMGPGYDKLIDSKFADMKNTGGRHGGSITAAQFLQRFINGTPWAHLDIAGTAMGSPQNDINQSWGSGWGVRLLDRLVADYYETGSKPA